MLDLTNSRTRHPPIWRADDNDVSPLNRKAEVESEITKYDPNPSFCVSVEVSNIDADMTSTTSMIIVNHYSRKWSERTFAPNIRQCCTKHCSRATIHNIGAWAKLFIHKQSSNQSLVLARLEKQLLRLRKSLSPRMRVSISGGYGDLPAPRITGHTKTPRYDRQILGYHWQGSTLR